ncbi:FGGY-family carbohydrate kinase, partial [Salmonella enterica subsp. enterica serovar Kentucky]|nr:FGGY-family carbohydrate kinase [Salmonella enterica subsp. enterica serovar Kentucky]
MPVIDRQIKPQFGFVDAIDHPVSDAELARCIFDSLALLYADILHELANLRGEKFTQLHIVGG